MKLLLLSNSATHARPYLSHALDAIQRYTAGISTSLLFVPYALGDHESYTEKVSRALQPLGLSVDGLHRYDDPVQAVRSCEAVFVGGGNTFRLLRTLRKLDLINPLREAIGAGALYIGSSAGTNVACPTIRTTNDMPIVDPGGFDALSLVPFQINPHYLDAVAESTHQGETRSQRISEFCEDNDVPVLAMREGAWLEVVNADASLLGEHGAVLFRPGGTSAEVAAGSDVSPLLSTVPRFSRD